MTGDRSCPSHQTLMSFLLGKLPPEQEEALNLHLEACAACEARAQQIEQESDPLIDVLRQISRDESADAPSRPVCLGGLSVCTTEKTSAS